MAPKKKKEKKKEKLKGCPFCGAIDGIVWLMDRQGRIKCDGCGAVGPWADNDKKGIKLWNTRALRG